MNSICISQNEKKKNTKQTPTVYFSAIALFCWHIDYLASAPSGEILEPCL